jgi:hypothetical protein
MTYTRDISLKRVQTFIFDVPRLKAMLGANALVGQVLRHELPRLLGDRGGHQEWPEGLGLADGGKDPLNAADDPADRDDPRALYARGILARDGGHFIVAFPTEAQAEAFRREAEAVLAERLPGVLFDADIQPFPKPKGERDGKPRTPNETHLFDLPVLQVCQETGREPATDRWLKDGKEIWQAASVSHRRDWGVAFHDGETRDLISLLRRPLYPDRLGKAPDDLEQLAAGDYVALIHADGNRIGQRFKEWRERCADSDPLVREAHGETFYHGMRVAVRQALIEALKDTFPETYETHPYAILMLGGDDLLAICRADRALKLAQAYAARLRESSLSDGAPLDVAIGVAIAKKTYPLHRLHELAESLAGSAKRLYRSLDEGERGSVIDWQVVTQSWFEGVAEARRRSERVRYRVDDRTETLLLTGRPYRVDDGGLAALLAAADQLDAVAETARSPLRALRAACEQGRLAGELAFDRLPERVRDTLAWPGAAAAGESPLWKPLGDAADGLHLTRALDIIGLREIRRLGNKHHDS